MRFSKLFGSRAFYLGLFILSVGILLTTTTSNYLAKNCNPPVLEDLFLNNLLYIKAGWTYDVLAILAVLITGAYIIGKKTQETPYAFVLYGITHFLRAIFILITPLGNPGLDNNPLITGPTFLAGYYFSGHTADAFLGFLITKGKYKIALLILLFSIIFCLLITRGHYSIDIFSGILFSYAVFCFGEKYLKRYFTIRDK